MNKFIVLLLLVSILLTALFFLYFGSDLTQEENTLKILCSIINLHVKNEDRMLIESGDFNSTYISRTRYGLKEVITLKLNEDGWSYKEQMGSSYVFVKGDNQIIIGTRLFTKHYFLWTIPKQ